LLETGRYGNEKRWERKRRSVEGDKASSREGAGILKKGLVQQVEVCKPLKLGLVRLTNGKNFAGRDRGEERERKEREGGTYGCTGDEGLNSEKE